MRHTVVFCLRNFMQAKGIAGVLHDMTVLVVVLCTQVEIKKEKRKKKKKKNMF
jgi:hypothetical protein